MSNPTPEIMPEIASRHARIVATGRSDYPNQINNVIAFPYIFRGALDCRSRAIDETMKVAATLAIAALARQPVGDEAGFDAEGLEPGPRYLIPKPFDRRLLPSVALAVAEAAMKAGLARVELDLDEYEQRLLRLQRVQG